MCFRERSLYRTGRGYDIGGLEGTENKGGRFHSEGGVNVLNKPGVPVAMFTESEVRFCIPVLGYLMCFVLFRCGLR